MAGLKNRVAPDTHLAGYPAAKYLVWQDMKIKPDIRPDTRYQKRPDNRYNPTEKSI